MPTYVHHVCNKCTKNKMFTQHSAATSLQVVAGTLKHAHHVQRPSEHQEDQGEGVGIVDSAVGALHCKYNAGQHWIDGLGFLRRAVSWPTTTF